MKDLNTLNEFGVPLHACNGYRQDEHYWAWLRHLRKSREAFEDAVAMRNMQLWKKP